jgi:hypothetical protein
MMPHVRAYLRGTATPREAAGALLLALLLLAAFAGILAAVPHRAAAPHVAGPVPLTVADTAPVGAVVPLDVGPVAAPDDTPVTLVVQDSYGVRAYRAPLRGGRAAFALPTEATRQAGLVHLTATVGGATGTAHLRLLPGAPVAPVVPLLGSRSIVANGRAESIVTVLPLDQFDNPAAEGTAVHVRALQPGGRQRIQTTIVAHLLAWVPITSGTRAGRTVVAASAGDAGGPSAALEEVAGVPQPFALSATPERLPADGRQLATLRTEPLRDRFGNVLPDGTRVTFVATMPDGTTRTIPASTLDGSAAAPLQAPAAPGIATVYAVAAEVESTPLRLRFTPDPLGSAPPREEP